MRAALLKFELRRRLNAHQSVESLHNWLEGQGYSSDESWRLIDDAQKTRFVPVREPDPPSTKARPGKRRMLLYAGLLWFGLGSVGTAAGWMFTAPGGSYFIWHGAILLGLAFLAAAWLVR